MHDLSTLKKNLNCLRLEILLMSQRGKAAHVASALSCVDLILGAHEYLHLSGNEANNIDRNRFILSKGHAVSALYAVLAYREFFPKELLLSFNSDGSSLPEHPSPFCVPGVDVATGSLGHGLPIAIGQALAAKIEEKFTKIIVLLGDGECNEGTTWESALFAPKHHLDNLIVLIDYNKWQATDRSEEVMQIAPFKEKWESFGWNCYEIDGNNIETILYTLDTLSKNTKPHVIIAHTIKGKGISFIEDDNNWHYRIPTNEEITLAKKELDLL